MQTSTHTTRFFTKKNGDAVVCELCPHHCRLAPSQIGICRTRQNINGALQVLTFGKLVAGSADPIEKKPLFHYLPGSQTFSIATVGCNLVCPFCQNHHLSAGPVVDKQVVSPSQVVSAVTQSSCASVACTYSEPILMLEYAEQLASLTKASDLGLVFVTNGQAAKKAAQLLGSLIDAANVDLKCFSKTKYTDILGGSLGATLRTIELLKAGDVWVEVTTLVIPGFNDSDKELTDIARFIAAIDPNIPWHVSRYHPAHRWKEPGPTPVATLMRARQIGVAAGLNFVYTGNVPGDDGEKTACPSCGDTVINRKGYHILDVALESGRCKRCGEPIAGKGMP